MSQFWLYITSDDTLKAQIVEIEEATGNLTEDTVLKIDLEEPLPPNGTVIIDLVQIDDINVDGVPPLGTTLLVQNDTVTLTDQNIVISNDVASDEETDIDDEAPHIDVKAYSLTSLLLVVHHIQLCGISCSYYYSKEAMVLEGASERELDMNYYYAYGIRNSFGLAFDPITERLWDTENGEDEYDEINIVNPGFNSGWHKIMGPTYTDANFNESELTMFKGAYYSDPVFSWKNSIGVTDIEFFNSAQLGKEYSNNLFVGDINNGNLYCLCISITYGIS